EGADITPDWLAAYGTAIREGRGFDDRDTVGSPPVMLVNEAVGRQMFPGEPLVGTPLQLTYRSDEFGDIPIGVKTVVGIAEDTVFRSIRSPALPAYYAPLAQRSDPMLWTYFYITVQAKAGSPALLTPSLTTALHAINPDLTLTFRTVAEQVDEALAQDRLVAVLAGLFGGLTLLIAALGLYGVTAQAVAERRMEIGVRMALGAAPARIMREVLGRVAVLVAAGVGVGMVVSVWLARFAAALFYGVGPHDPATLARAAAVSAVGHDPQRRIRDAAVQLERHFDGIERIAIAVDDERPRGDRCEQGRRERHVVVARRETARHLPQRANLIVAVDVARAQRSPLRLRQRSASNCAIAARTGGGKYGVALTRTIASTRSRRAHARFSSVLAPMLIPIAFTRARPR